MDGVSFDRLSRPVSILFGIGHHDNGPSVYHSLSFVLAGMGAATAFEQPAGARVRHFVAVSALLLVTVSVAGAFMIPDPPTVAWTKFIDYTYRGANEPGYFLIGIGTSIVGLNACLVAFGSRPVPGFVAYLLPLGCSSLFAYTLGNVLLNLFGSLSGHVSAVVFLGAFFVAVIAATRAVTFMPAYQPGAPVVQAL